MRVAARSRFLFERIPPEVTLGTSAVYVTPQIARAELGDLTRMAFVRGRFRAVTVFEGGTAPDGAQFTVRLTDGARVYAEESFTTSLTGGFRYYMDANVDLSRARAGSPLYVEFEDIAAPSNAADGGAEVYGVLDIEVPLAEIGGC